MIGRILTTAAACALVMSACTGSEATPTTPPPRDPTIVTTSLQPDSTAAPASSTTATEPPPSVATPATLPPAPGADVIFSGGPVLTMDPDLGLVAALAVTGDAIVAVGSEQEVLDFRGPETTMIDLEGRALLPGFVDPHTHILTDMNSGIIGGQQLALQNGITTLGDASVEPDTIDSLLETADSGDLRVRTSLYLTRTSNCGEDFGTWYEEFPPTRGFGEMLRIGGVKVFADGGTCGPVSAGSSFIEGLAPAPPFHSPDTLEAFVREADAAGYQLLIHAQGDLAVADAQDAIVAVLGGAPNDKRHRIDHNAIVTEGSLSRYAEHDIVAVVFGMFSTCADIPWTQFWRDNGENWRRLIDANPGAHIAWHGDDPGLPPINPLADLSSYVTRTEIAADGTVCRPEPWLEATTITVDEALVMMTREAAYALDRDTEVGTVTPGKLADLIVLSADPTAVPHDQIIDITVEMTMVGGVIEHCTVAAAAMCGFDPAPPTPTTGNMALGAATAASASLADDAQALAVDGETGTSWTAGSGPVQWFEVDLGSSRDIGGVRLTVDQFPPGPTVHVVEIDGVEIHTFAGDTVIDDVLEVFFESPTMGRRVRVTTVESPSWVAWREIEVLSP
ncbi:MAG: amidohydrolase family protein [Acidimicrobiia bacterium]